MNLLFSLVLLSQLVPQNQNLPKLFDQLPAQLREEATVIFTGTYSEGRGPCMYLPDGTTLC